MTERIRYRNREEWLLARNRGIGASEAAAAVGESKWMSRIDLWKIKTGQKEAPDLSGNEAVQRGIRMEGAIRGVFAAMHPELKIYYHPFDILFQTERPWLFATLDGETVDRKSGELGIMEVKNVQPRNREEWEIWNNGVPNHYYLQILHQHLATNRRKLWLIACLYGMNGDMTIREYEWTVDDGFHADAEWLLGNEEIFMGYVNSRRIPAMKLSI